MYYANGWFCLNDDPREPEQDRIDRAVTALRGEIGSSPALSRFCRIEPVNYETVLTVAMGANRPGADAPALRELIERTAALLPGTYGLLHEYDDERTSFPGGNAFVVTVMRRGSLTQVADPFFSPVNPTIED